MGEQKVCQATGFFNQVHWQGQGEVFADAHGQMRCQFPRLSGDIRQGGEHTQPVVGRGAGVGQAAATQKLAHRNPGSASGTDARPTFVSLLACRLCAGQFVFETVAPAFHAFIIPPLAWWYT